MLPFFALHLLALSLLIFQLRIIMTERIAQSINQHPKEILKSLIFLSLLRFLGHFINTVIVIAEGFCFFFLICCDLCQIQVNTVFLCKFPQTFQFLLILFPLLLFFFRFDLAGGSGDSFSCFTVFIEFFRGVFIALFQVFDTFLKSFGISFQRIHIIFHFIRMLFPVFFVFSKTHVLACHNCNLPFKIGSPVFSLHT